MKRAPFWSTAIKINCSTWGLAACEGVGAEMIDGWRFHCHCNYKEECRARRIEVLFFRRKCFGVIILAKIHRILDNVLTTQHLLSSVIPGYWLKICANECFTSFILLMSWCFIPDIVVASALQKKQKTIFIIFVFVSIFCFVSSKNT